jgi:glutamate synthase (NADPH) large chain
MSKMGISTYQSYCGAQIFDAVGLKSDFVSQYFTGTATRIEGVALDEIAEETVRRHRDAFGDAPVYRGALDVGGEYALRLRGEDHVWTAQTVATLQHAVRGNSLDKYKAFARVVNEQTERLLTIRGLFRIKSAEEDGRKPVPLDEVEPAKNLVRRFSTGAMSYGSISREAHTTLAIAMNRIGGKSNTGEGGEESDRYKPLPNGDSMRSAIKQVASGRFGVTAEYLVNSDVMQIKMAQGAKPGEGGQLPGHKVDKTIAKVRHSTPGVALISPPPHHDIYSIEDLAQLIFDLKNANPTGDVSVKLVSEVGVGTVAAGVSKARADHVTIAGFEGGTGASPLTSIKHAGSPWEIGLAETHQTLVINRLRGRIAVQVDGGIRTGRDVVVGALLGADEFGFATAPLIAAGCIMMRKCHLNTCPVGVATQDPVLRKKFVGQPEHVINYFFFVADEVRELMAALGYRTFNEMVGQMQMLDQRQLVEHWKAKGLDFSKLFNKPKAAKGTNIYNCEKQDHKIHDILDRKLIAESQAALDRGAPVRLQTPIRNTNRTAGGMLSGEVATRYGHAGLPDGTIHVRFTGTAGQSFGAWLARGITFELEGDANDYVGKGLSGARIVVRPAPSSLLRSNENTIIGNTVLYGATAGTLFAAGQAGERFAVRNSGADAVVEGCGSNGCEYMTGGTVVILGAVGDNFGAGFTGGMAFVYDPDELFEKRVNPDTLTWQRVSSAHWEKVARDLVAAHVEATSSRYATMLLHDWDRTLPRFWQVVPKDYAKYLPMPLSDAPEEQAMRA